jgi:hypothetical protein
MQALSEDGIESFYFPASDLPSDSPEQVPYNGKGWAAIVRSKIEIVHALLKAGLNVLWTDGDVVWLRNVLSDVRASLGSSALAFQCTGLIDPGVRWDEPSQQWVGTPPPDRRGGGTAPIPNMCAGFYYARATEECCRLFDPLRINPVTFRLEEDHLNDALRDDGIRVAMLEPRRYVNGKLWLKYPEPGLEPFVIHYNYISGAEKQAAMAERGHWYVNDSEQDSTFFPARTQP